MNDEGSSPAKRTRRTREKLRELDSQPGSVKVARALRALLPGDQDYGDPLSTAGDDPSALLGQRLSALTAERPSAMREVGLSALQVWQSLSEAQGRGRGEREVTILFTDLVDFSAWALEAGDTMAVDLLREVAHVVEPPIEDGGGRVVKRLGDGLMAVFDDPAGAVGAALDAVSAIEGVEVGGHRPSLRAGVHTGRPRKVGRDYLGVDVNVAARVAEAAGAGEVLVSGAACERLDEEALDLKRKRRFKAKGAPADLEVFAAARTQ
jgi:adenylate cyclase